MSNKKIILSPEQVVQINLHIDHFHKNFMRSSIDPYTGEVSYESLKKIHSGILFSHPIKKQIADLLDTYEKELKKSALYVPEPEIGMMQSKLKKLSEELGVSHAFQINNMIRSSEVPTGTGILLSNSYVWEIKDVMGHRVLVPTKRV